MNKTLFIGMLACIAMATSVATSQAGSKYSYPVVVTSTGAYGALSSTRNTPDSVAYIVCNVASYEASQSGYCQARSSTGTLKSCATTNSEMLRAIRSLNGDSYVRFRVNSAGVCTMIQVAHSSLYAPKQD